MTGYQDFVDAAPVDLIYVADMAHLPTGIAGRRALFAAACAGAIIQNVYLFCAARGLSTVVRTSFDREPLASALGLGADEKILLTQTVGYARQV